jgi:hypothetical protein
VAVRLVRRSSHQRGPGDACSAEPHPGFAGALPAASLPTVTHGLTPAVSPPPTGTATVTMEPVTALLPSVPPTVTAHLPLPTQEGGGWNREASFVPDVKSFQFLPNVQPLWQASAQTVEVPHDRSGRVASLGHPVDPIALREFNERTTCASIVLGTPCHNEPAVLCSMCAAHL